MKVTVQIAVMLGAVFGLTGCMEGGTFFSNFEAFSNKEAQRADEFAPTLIHWSEVERERPREFYSNFRSFNQKEMKSRDEIRETFRRYREVEYDKRPKISAMSPRQGLTKKKKKRAKFPNEDG